MISRLSSRLRDERGTVTAELALVLPAVVIVLTAMLACGSVVLAKIECGQAARAGARAGALGHDDAAIREAATQAADGVEVAVERSPDSVTVTIRKPVGLSAAGIGPRVVTASAQAYCEPDTGCG